MTKDIKRLVERATAGLAVLALGSSLTVTSLLTPAAAHAFPTGGQVQSRAIYMSNSTPSTTASYEVSFKPATTATIKGIILDFCAESPIIGDATCTKPSGFSIGASPSVTTTAQSAGTNSPVATTALGGTWTATSLNSNRTLELTNASTPASWTAGTTYGFVVSSITNPSQATAGTTGTFYARLITYTSDTGNIASYAPGTEGSADAEDYGGFALSTAYNVSVTAKVQETLSFCTSLNDLSSSSANTCASAVNPTLTIGHGTPQILSNSTIDMTSAYTQESTNASSGMAIRMHATNACANAGLSTNGGANCSINGADNTTASTQTAGGTFFGLMVGPSSLTGSTATSQGTMTPDNNYNVTGSTTPTAISGTATSNAYGMDNTTNSGVGSAYGDLIASSTGPISQVNNQLAFAATAGLTVPAGIYTGSESLIATGTF